MQVSAKLKNLRVSSRKTRLVADMVRGKKVGEAKIQLQFSTKKTSNDILNLLNSAISNAKNNFNLNEENLYIQTIVVNDGPVLKRWRPRAMGRASAIKKRTCSIEIILGEIVAKSTKEDKKVEKKEVRKTEKKSGEKKTDKDSKVSSNKSDKKDK